MQWPGEAERCAIWSCLNVLLLGEGGGGATDPYNKHSDPEFSTDKIKTPLSTRICLAGQKSYVPRLLYRVTRQRETVSTDPPDNAPTPPCGHREKSDTRLD